jgi:hypothetical protein
MANMRNESLRQANELLGAGIGSLDISASEHAAVVVRYELLGNTLDQYWANSPLENLVYPQGSFALGTVTRKVHRNDDIDIDLVVVRGLSRSSTTQAELKMDTGRGLKLFMAHPRSGDPNISESDRCWTLEYPGMHMDVLPAIPEGNGSMISITDKNVSKWQPSNPKGYSDWFERTAAREIELRGRQATAGVEVDDIPTWRRKTNLQLAVQTLKRHRDIYFTGALHRRPSSIVITTLAALSYRHNTVDSSSGDLFDALRAIVNGLESEIYKENGLWMVENPAMPGENFADYWEHEPWRAGYLFEWIDAAKQEFSDMPVSQGNDAVLNKIGRTLGVRAKTAGARSLAQPFLQARRTGSLRAVGGSGLLTTAPTVSGKVIPDHQFRGGQRE